MYREYSANKSVEWLQKKPKRRNQNYTSYIENLAS